MTQHHHHIRLSRNLHLSRCSYLILSLVIALLLSLRNELSLALRPSLILPSCRTTSAQLVFEFKLSCYQVLVGAMDGTLGSAVADV